MKQTFYIASSRDRIDDVREVARVLAERGMVDAFAWPEHFDHRCSRDMCGVIDRPFLARLELAAAATCDLFIGIARLGKGSHVELGAALYTKLDHKRVILVGVDCADSVFYDADGVEHARSITDLIGMFDPAAAERRRVIEQAGPDLRLGEG